METAQQATDRMTKVYEDLRWAGGYQPTTCQPPTYVCPICAFVTCDVVGRDLHTRIFHGE